MYMHMNMQWSCILHVSDREQLELEPASKKGTGSGSDEPFVAITKYTTPICIAVQATLFIHLGDGCSSSSGNWQPLVNPPDRLAGVWGG